MDGLIVVCKCIAILVVFYFGMNRLLTWMDKSK